MDPTRASSCHPSSLLSSFRLVDEVAELEESVRKLELKTDDAEDRLRNLQHTRLSLEKDQCAFIRRSLDQLIIFIRIPQRATDETIKKGSFNQSINHSWTLIF